LEEGFGEFEKVYMNSSNLIYVVIIFLKLKIYVLISTISLMVKFFLIFNFMIGILLGLEGMVSL